MAPVMASPISHSLAGTHWSVGLLIALSFPGALISLTTRVFCIVFGVVACFYLLFRITYVFLDWLKTKWASSL